MTAVTGNRWVRPWAAGLACLLSLLAAGCGENYYLGTRPVTAALETTLRPGKSTPAEVIAALGKPSGQGGVMLPVLHKRARESWTYYFEKGHVRVKRDSERDLFPSVPVHRQNPGLLFTAKRGSGLDVDSRRIFLFVYFDDGVYDGYLWFSSLPQP